MWTQSQGENVPRGYHIADRTGAWLDRSVLQYIFHQTREEEEKGSFYGEIDQYCHLHLELQTLRGWADSEGERGGKENKQRRLGEQYSQWKCSNRVTGVTQMARHTQKVNYEAVEEAETARSLLSRTWLEMSVWGLCVCVFVSVSGGAFLHEL